MKRPIIENDKFYKHSCEFFNNRKMESTIQDLKIKIKASQDFVNCYEYDNYDYIPMNEFYKLEEDFQKKTIPNCNSQNMETLQSLEKQSNNSKTKEKIPKKTYRNTFSTNKNLTNELNNTQARMINMSKVLGHNDENLTRRRSKRKNIRSNSDFSHLSGNTEYKVEILENDHSEYDSEENDVDLYKILLKQKLKKKKLREKKETEIIYKQVFDKKYEFLINPKAVSLKKRQEIQKYMKTRNQNSKKHNYIYDKILHIKSKIFFMKSVYDYIYPKIVIQKFHLQDQVNKKNELNQEKKLMEKAEAKLQSSKHINMNFIKRLSRLDLPVISGSLSKKANEFKPNESCHSSFKKDCLINSKYKSNINVKARTYSQDYEPSIRKPFSQKQLLIGKNIDQKLAEQIVYSDDSSDEESKESKSLQNEKRIKVKHSNKNSLENVQFNLQLINRDKIGNTNQKLNKQESYKYKEVYSNLVDRKNMNIIGKWDYLSDSNKGDMIQNKTHAKEPLFGNRSDLFKTSLTDKWANNTFKILNNAEGSNKERDLLQLKIKKKIINKMKNSTLFQKETAQTRINSFMSQKNGKFLNDFRNLTYERLKDYVPDLQIIATQETNK